MGSAERYLFRQLAIAMIFVGLALTCAIWLTQSLRFVELIVSRGMSVGLFLELTLTLLPSFLGILLPIALFFAVLFTYNKMTNDRELVVMRTAGISQWGLARPALILAGLVALIGDAISLYVMPVSFKAFKELEFAIRNTYSAALLQEGTFNTVTDDVTVYVRERIGEEELQGILVQDNRNAAKSVTMMAERGVMLRAEGVPRIVMFNGNRQELTRETGEVSMIFFDRWSFSIDWLGKGDERRWREPNERFLHELLWPGDSDAEQYYADQFRAEGHNRLAAPLYPVVFTLIALAALLSGQFDKRGQAKRLGAATAAALLIQAGALGTLNLATKTPPAIPLIYLNVLVPGLIALGYMLRAERRRPSLMDVQPPAGFAAGPAQ